MGNYSNQFSAGASKDDVSHSNHEMVDCDVNQALTVSDWDKGNNSELLKGLSVDDNNCKYKCLGVYSFVKLKYMSNNSSWRTPPRNSYPYLL
jgi:hypothetical protein